MPVDPQTEKLLAAPDRPKVTIRTLHKLGRAYFRRRYTILFYSLLVTMVASPILSAMGRRATLIEALLAANLLVAIMPFTSGISRRCLLAVMVLASVARPLSAWLGYTTLSDLTLAAWTLIGLLAAAGALHFAMHSSRVEAEHIFAALSAYLLAGIYFGLLYWVLEQLQPGTFGGADFSRSGATYFSFVTLATLGYGDIVPRSDLGRSLAVLEAIGGQLFLAVLVARLLSLYSLAPKD